MRQKERIDIIFDNINWSNFIKYLHIYETNQEIDDVVMEIIEHEDELRQTWKENPDWRLTQLLVNTGVMPNTPGEWYYIEEVDYMIDNGVCLPQELLFWGTFGKDGKQPLKFIAIKDMETEHLKACIDAQKHMSQMYRDAMTLELECRNLIES